MAGETLGPLPLLCFRHRPTNPENEQCGQHADQEHGAAGETGQQEVCQAGKHHAEIHARLEHGGHPRPPPPRPGLREEGGADCPFAADTQGGQEAEDEQLPPRLREERQSREQGIGKDGEHKSPAAAQPIRDAPEKSTSKCPTDQERCLDPGTVVTDLRILLAGNAEQLGDKRGGDQHIQVHVQAVEQPAQPRRNPRSPLLRRQIA